MSEKSGWSRSATASLPVTYGELGIRHEDAIVITPDGAENLTR